MMSLLGEGVAARRTLCPQDSREAFGSASNAVGLCSALWRPPLPSHGSGCFRWWWPDRQSSPRMLRSLGWLHPRSLSRALAMVLPPCCLFLCSLGSLRRCNFPFQQKIFLYFNICQCIRILSCGDRKVKVLVTQLCPTPWDPTDCSPPGSSVHEIPQARILELVAIPFSKGSFQPRDWTWIPCFAGKFFTFWAGAGRGVVGRMVIERSIPNVLPFTVDTVLTQTASVL